MIVEHVHLADPEVTLVTLATVAAGTMLFLCGAWAVVGNWKLPEDDGTTMVPPAWPYYLAVIGFTVAAAINTMSIIGVIEV